MVKANDACDLAGAGVASKIAARRQGVATQPSMSRHGLPSLLLTDSDVTPRKPSGTLNGLGGLSSIDNLKDTGRRSPHLIPASGGFSVQSYNTGLEDQPAAGCASAVTAKEVVEFAANLWDEVSSIFDLKVD